MKKQDIIKPLKLVVIIRDMSPFIHMQEPVSHRLVEIELTNTQQKQLALKWTGSSMGKDNYENISSCFLQEVEEKIPARDEKE